MLKILHVAEAVLKTIDHLAKPLRANLLRRPLKDAIFHLQTTRMREAYRLRPDSAEEADDWDPSEEWNV